MRPAPLRLLRHLAGERGQDTIEWIGVLAVVAALLGVVLLVIPTLEPMVARDVECLVAKVLGGSCPSSSSTPYPVSVSTKDVGYSGRVAIVDGSRGYTVTLTKYSDGTSTITVVNTGKLGVSLQAGAEVDLGPLGGAGADASIGGGGYGDQTETWKFPTWKQGQKYYQGLSSGSSLGLAAHDGFASSPIGELPVVGGWATGLFDSVTGAKGAPTSGSLPHKYLYSTATGAGAQGSADAGAHVSFGPLSAGVGASLEGHAGLEHVNSGPEKGDWQLVAGLDGNADGSLAGDLLGAGGQGTVNGDVVVTFSPSGKPETLEVEASGDGVWDVNPSPDLSLNSGSPSEPGKSEGSGSQTGSGSEPSSGGESEPLLKLDTQNAGGSGVGSSFTGTLDLANDPAAQQDLQSVLEGNPSGIGGLIDQMNSNGTESVQHYRIDRSSSSVGGNVNAGPGLGFNLNDGGSTADYGPPQTRSDGGAWHTGS